MIKVSIALSDEGVVAELAAVGHAGQAPRGADIVCSAFTVLLRTFVRTLEASPGVVWESDDGLEGFHLAVSGVTPATAEQYRGWCEFLLRGFEDLVGDEPRRIRIDYGRYSGRLFHGS